MVFVTSSPERDTCRIAIIDSDSTDAINPPPRKSIVRIILETKSQQQPRRQGELRIERAAFPFLAASGLAEACGDLTALRAFQVGDVSVVSPLVSTYGLVALVLAALFLRDLERVSLRVVLAAALIVSGVFVVMRSVSL